MSSFDPIAAAIDWLDAYRAASFSIVDMYAIDGAIECTCDGSKTLYGRAAISEYWRHRFADEPAGELVDLQVADGDIVVSYGAPHEVVQAILRFDTDGKISLSRCRPIGPAVGPLHR